MGLETGCRVKRCGSYKTLGYLYARNRGNSYVSFPFTERAESEMKKLSPA